MKHPLLLTVFLTLPAAAQEAKGAKPVPPSAAEADDITVVKQVPYHPAVGREPFQVLGDSLQKAGGGFVDDIAVKGYTKRDGMLYAVCSDSRGNVREFEIGHQFKDGIIAAIDDKSVTFHQWDPNTSNRNVFKKVVKTFKREETKR